MTFRCLLGCLLMALGLQSFSQPYMMAYFSDVPGLHLAYSHDAETWTEIKQSKPFFMPDKETSRGVFRDPCLYKGPDGTFHMVWTVGFSDSFGYSSSKDLIHWTPQRRIRIMQSVATTKNVWAPDIFFDEKSNLFYIFWSSTVENRMSPDSDATNDKGFDHRIYYTTTSDFNTFSSPRLFFDPGYTVIDASVVRFRRKYLMFIKDERRHPATKNIKVAVTRNLADGFPISSLSRPLTQTDDAWAEGPAPLLTDKYIYVYYDKYCIGKYGAMRSRRGRSWIDVSQRCSFPKGMRHSSAFCVTPDLLKSVMEASK